MKGLTEGYMGGIDGRIDGVKKGGWVRDRRKDI
jgi:hypothetical protein